MIHVKQSQEDRDCLADNKGCWFEVMYSCMSAENEKYIICIWFTTAWILKFDLSEKYVNQIYTAAVTACAVQPQPFTAFHHSYLMQ